jgi:hypothetical protein
MLQSNPAEKDSLPEPGLPRIPRILIILLNFEGAHR